MKQTMTHKSQENLKILQKMNLLKKTLEEEQIQFSKLLNQVSLKITSIKKSLNSTQGKMLMLILNCNR